MVTQSTTSQSEGQLAGARTFRCAGCGFPITLLEGDATPACPRCESRRFESGSMFSRDTSDFPAPPPVECPSWVSEVRAEVARNVPHLAWERDDRIEVTAIPEGFTRIGRSLRAEIRLLDPTVSRRHALIHREGPVTTVVDDHSLNGVFVDGTRVDWLSLEDGHELEVGSFRLYFIAPD
jgi:FHA domain